MKTVRNYRFDDIVNAMKNRNYMGLVDPQGNCHIGVVNAIQAEDGSGKNWIVTLRRNNGKTSKVFVHAS